jgi:hypothetical protein
VLLAFFPSYSLLEDSSGHSILLFCYFQKRCLFIKKEEICLYFIILFLSIVGDFHVIVRLNFRLVLDHDTRERIVAVN